jgi:hypothetical protein
MNTKLTDRLFGALRYLALIIVGAILVSHGPAARAAGQTLQLGQEYWATNNCAYIWNGYQGVPTYTCRYFLQGDSATHWMQYDPTKHDPAIYMDGDLAAHPGFLYVYARGGWMAFPWHNTFAHFLDVPTASVWFLVGTGWITIPQLQVAIEAKVREQVTATQFLHLQPMFVNGTKFYPTDAIGLTAATEHARSVIFEE